MVFGLSMILGVIALSQVGKILIFLLTLSVLVMLHEYGHFIVARRNGVRVNEFSLGMGPLIYGRKSPRGYWRLEQPRFAPRTSMPRPHGSSRRLQIPKPQLPRTTTWDALHGYRGGSTKPQPNSINP